MDSYRKKFMTGTIIKRKLKEQTQLHFLKRLHRLLKNGYSLLDALEVMQWDKEICNLSEMLAEKIKKGLPLDEAMEKLDFHKVIVSYLYFVRVNGNLISSLEKCIHLFEHRITYIQKFSQVIRYPIILSTFFIVLLIFLKNSVLPSFLELFKSNASSSKTVHYSIILIDFVSTIFIILVLLLLLSSIIWYFYKGKVPIEQQINFYKRIPIVNSFLKMQTSYYFSSHLAMFLQAGFPIKDTLKNLSKQERIPIISFYATLLTEQLTNGSYIDSLLKELPFIDNQLANLFNKTTNATSLATDLTIYAEFSAEDMERKIMRIIILIQPIFFVLLACFIILVYVTIMWPMFQLIQTV
ncbi:competence type IV pilus assembly protein ComGB [Pseudogracilibacillus sp. SO30301A]|uniref:competence type IV pilus assembly protein ComGB n=1 Tax=Pseudogracilibacillus sp. SO30301A TaxID=3098291 RepID=UPI00300E0BAA